jgi:Cellulase (glycosyl hydrolase family 5)
MAAVGAGCVILCTPAQGETGSMPIVQAKGSGLVAGGRPFRAFGFNHMFQVQPTLDYLAKPTAAGLRRVRTDFSKARRLGANTIRVFLELPVFMSGPHHVRQAQLEALGRVITAAEHRRLYVDITGAVDWHVQPSTDWYDELTESRRWGAEERFWRAVARVTRPSNAVLLYELASEPATCDAGAWRAAEMEGHWFVHCITRWFDGRDPYSLAREWTRRLRAAIRSEDRRHLIGVGLLPLRDWPFDPRNIADLLDVVVLHEYPAHGELAKSTDLVRYFASHRRPLILGETFKLLCDRTAFEEFLVESSPWLDGALSFFDGRAPAEVVGSSGADLAYRDNLNAFLGLREAFLGSQ